MLHISIQGIQIPYADRYVFVTGCDRHLGTSYADAERLRVRARQNCRQPMQTATPNDHLALTRSCRDALIRAADAEEPRSLVVGVARQRPRRRRPARPSGPHACRQERLCVAESASPARRPNECSRQEGDVTACGGETTEARRRMPRYPGDELVGKEEEETCSQTRVHFAAQKKKAFTPWEA